MAKTLVGVVSSDKTDKTIVVNVVTKKTHPIYKKQYISTTKFMAHDESNDAHIGDKVVISETRPISARKRFILDKVVERAPIRHVEVIDPEVAKAAGEKEKPAAEEATEEKASASAKTTTDKEEKK